MGSSEPEKYRKLFIGGLDFTTTDDSLKAFFEQWGKIVDYVVIKDPKSKRSRRFGFITYSQSSMVDQAMSNRPHQIDGREVETKRAVPPDEIKKSDTTVSANRIFVTGIKNQSENDLLEYFGKFGNITKITIVTDKGGQRRGFGFIEYDDTDSVDKAILVKSHQVDGEKLDVEKSISRSDGGGNRSSWRGNPRNELCGGHNNRLNGGGGGYRNSGMGGGYGSVGGGYMYGGSAGGYNSNSGGAWKGSGGAPQILVKNYPSWGNQRGGGGGWGGSQQPSNNWGPNQSYGGGGGGPMRSNYTSNIRTTPYGNPGAGNGNAGNAGSGQNPGRRYQRITFY
eukprot:XP_016664070.1 PREDICTED: heterogeneous nuclear ribonucleoprotein 87F-like isoform X2 [Acyrthosiphon pisum]